MTSINLAQAYEIINQLNLDELNELSEVISDTLILKRQRFSELVETLQETLNELFENYPNAKIPLTVSPDETIDLMDLIVPSDFCDKCEMGD